MNTHQISQLTQDIDPENHSVNDYFSLIKIAVEKKNSFPAGSQESEEWQMASKEIYDLVEDEIRRNSRPPIHSIKFGTSGWRGILGKDLSCKSVSQVTQAIIEVYDNISNDTEMSEALGVASVSEAKSRGCVIGHDNRFGGKILCDSVSNVLTSNGFKVYYAGESTTGCLSAAVLELNAAFSINLTPSHNPLEYGGFKFNAADGGPAAPVITNKITSLAQNIVKEDRLISVTPNPDLIRPLDALQSWQSLVKNNQTRHGLDYAAIIKKFEHSPDCVVAVDAVHGASRIHIKRLFNEYESDRLILLRETADPTFGGVAPEPSTENMKLVTQTINNRPEPLKLGVVLDPDGDRIRFTDGKTEINMNLFGAMAYHYLHEIKRKSGMVAKTVATSNFANAIAEAFGEEVFEPRVGFKEFKPVIDKALVCFEESDGITVIGHTPEKDGYIGLLLALDMMLELKQNIGAYLEQIRNKYGKFYPEKDGITVTQQGDELKQTLAGLKKYEIGNKIRVGAEERTIKQIITIDGLKFILDDNSWLMIRPSGTEPKVRFYVEARTEEGKDHLFTTARQLLAEIGLL